MTIARSFQTGGVVLLGFLLVSVVVPGCSPRAVRGVQSDKPLMHAENMGAHRPFRAAATLTLFLDGVRRRARAEIVWNNDSSFSTTVYDPFGGIVAELWYDSTGAWYQVGSTPYPIPSDNNLSLPTLIPAFPFTFSQLVRIITGRLPEEPTNSGGAPSEVFLEVQHSKKDVVEKVRFSAVDSTSTTHITYEEFAGAMPRRIKIASAEQNDYLNLMYDRIIFE